MASRYCNGNAPRPPRLYHICHTLMVVFSFTAASHFGAALSDIWAYRNPDGHWTGRWAETVATVILGMFTIIYFALFWFVRGKVLPVGLIAIHSVYLGLLIESLVLTCSAGNSKWWEPTPDSGEFWEMWKAGEKVYLECDTLSKKGVNCGVGELRHVSNLQIIGIATLSATLFLNIIMLVLMVRANANDFKQKWRRRMERWHGCHNISSAKVDDDSFTFANAIPSEEKEYVTIDVKKEFKC